MDSLPITTRQKPIAVMNWARWANHSKRKLVNGQGDMDKHITHTAQLFAHQYWQGIVKVACPHIILLLAALILVGCAEEQVIPETLRFGDSHSVSDYILVKKDLNVTRIDQDEGVASNIVEGVNIYYKNTRDTSDSGGGLISVHVDYTRRDNPYSQPQNIYYQQETDPLQYKHQLFPIKELAQQTITWYPKKPPKGYSLGDYYTIADNALYDHILINRRKLVATVCRVHTYLNKNIKVYFHFTTTQSVESDLIFIHGIIKQIAAHIHLIKESDND